MSPDGQGSLDLERLPAPRRTGITAVRAPSSDPRPASEQSAATCARELGDRRGVALPGEDTDTTSRKQARTGTTTHSSQGEKG